MGFALLMTLMFFMAVVAISTFGLAGLYLANRYGQSQGR